MKTINQLAASLGVTRQTIYNAVKSAGLSIDDLTAEKRGNTRLFDAAAEDRVKVLLLNRHSKPVKSESVKIDKLTADLKAARAEVDRLTAELEAEKGNAAQLTADLETAKKDSEATGNQLEAERARNDQLTADLARANNRIDALLQMGLDRAAKALPAAKEPGRIRKAWRALTGKE